MEGDFDEAMAQLDNRKAGSFDQSMKTLNDRMNGK